MPWTNDREARERSNRTYGAAWRRARERCLRDAQWRCEIRIEGVCIGAASQVDHIIGAALDPNHRQLRAACRPCHAQVTARQGNDARWGHQDDPPCQPRTAW